MKIGEIIKEYRNGDWEDPIYAEQLINLFVHHITVQNGSVVICYNFGTKKESPDNLQEEIKADFLKGFEFTPIGGADNAKREPRIAVKGTRVYYLVSL